MEAQGKGKFFSLARASAYAYACARPVFTVKQALSVLLALVLASLVKTKLVHTRGANANASDVDTSNANASTVRYVRAFGHLNMADEVDVLILGLCLIRRRRRVQEHRARRPKRVWA